QWPQFVLHALRARQCHGAAVRSGSVRLPVHPTIDVTEASEVIDGCVSPRSQRRSNAIGVRIALMACENSDLEIPRSRRERIIVRNRAKSSQGRFGVAIGFQDL